ncbi:MAG: sigma 54-interacting transcriptional regulator [Bacteriovorax sp.]|jgi:two-component system response regulator HupR/HoxA|nr:sigma 54-interacting transcriptional regulator [Bacteriovorax sp.]
MINWHDIGKLHVISKLEGILGKWFDVEMFYTDSHGKLWSDHSNKNYAFKSHFMKVQMQTNVGHEFLADDIERMVSQLSSGKEEVVIYQSSYKNVKGVAFPIKFEGEFAGAVFVYPFVLDTSVSSEIDELKKQLIESGCTPVDAAAACEKIKKMWPREMEYVKELTGLLAEEMVTFHEEITKREHQIHELSSQVGEKYRYHSMVGKSKKMQSIYALLEKISSAETSVMIQGENGTGKELVAKAIHFYSPRKDKVFLPINCSAFNENLLDSALFGHVKGSFTGAVKDEKGLFETANGGTLFLDEIGDTSLSMQVKLLRVLQEGTFLPVGATVPKKVDVRIIAATNKNLKEMMAKGEFREDLYYRINVININIPALRERHEDIPLLMDYFLKKRCDEAGKAMKSIAKKCMEKMLDYPWPGNVRELENEVERLVVLSGDEKVIGPENLSPMIADWGVAAEPAFKGVNTEGTLREALEQLEIMMIREGLKRCNFNKSKLAKELDVSRASLIMKVEKYGLDKRVKAA